MGHFGQNFYLPKIREMSFFIENNHFSARISVTVKLRERPFLMKTTTLTAEKTECSRRPKHAPDEGFGGGGQICPPPFRLPK
jgi:hypothetical protein